MKTNYMAAIKVATALLIILSSNSTLEAKRIKANADYIAFEAEQPTNAISGGWALRKEGESLYNQISSNVESSNGAYIEYVEGVTDGLDVVAGIDVLKYTFTPKSSGTYYLSGRVAQQLQQPEGEAAWDQCNDIFVKMEGDFTAAGEASHEILSSWNKLYGRGYNSWGSFMNIDVDHAKFVACYNLEAGKRYTFSISARSRGVCIDYFLLSKTPLDLLEKRDLVELYGDMVP